MTRETKVGLLISCSFLCLVGGVLFFKLKDSSAQDLDELDDVEHLMAELEPVPAAAEPKELPPLDASPILQADNRSPVMSIRPAPEAPPVPAGSSITVPPASSTTILDEPPPPPPSSRPSAKVPLVPHVPARADV